MGTSLTQTTTAAKMSAEDNKYDDPMSESESGESFDGQDDAGLTEEKPLKSALKKSTFAPGPAYEKPYPPPDRAQGPRRQDALASYARNHCAPSYDQHRYHRPCRSRKVHGRQGRLRCADRPVQERAGAQHHNQAGICQRQNLQMR